MYKDSPLGKGTEYIETYTPSLLFPIPRKLARDKIGLRSTLPFEGVDIWNAYEISWLNPKGKPNVAMGTFTFQCTSLNVVESKSLKLYLNSFNQTSFDSLHDVQQTIENDLTQISQGTVTVDLFLPSQTREKTLSSFSGTCLDTLDIETDTYEVHPEFLKKGSDNVEETLYSDLLKSNCLVTGQPDWSSIFIHYSGYKIDHPALLKYIISYRNHTGLHEDCVEQIYKDILERCAPKRLTVYARYTRRGGLDINPFRSNFERAVSNMRQYRQ